MGWACGVDLSDLGRRPHPPRRHLDASRTSPSDLIPPPLYFRNRMNFFFRGLVRPLKMVRSALFTLLNLILYFFRALFLAPVSVNRSEVPCSRSGSAAFVSPPLRFFFLRFA